MIPAKPGFFRRLFGTTANSDTQQDRRKGPRQSPQQGTRVLLIDDSTTILAVLGKMLRQAGYEVLAAPDAESGIETALRERPHLIFLDIVLPGMNGFAALRVLRREEPSRDIPIIMMSGNMQATEQYYAQRIGADDFLKKPFPRAELFAKIDRLMGDEGLPRRPRTGGGDIPPQIVGGGEHAA